MFLAIISAFIMQWPVAALIIVCLLAAIAAVFAFKEKQHCQRMHEKEIASLNRDITLAVEAGKIGVWGYDLINHSLYNIYGKVFDKSPITEEEGFALVHPDDLDEFKTLFTRIIRGEKRKGNCIVRFLNTKTGKYEYIEKEIIGIFDENGDVERIIGTHHDITESRVHEQNLKNQSEILEIKNQELEEYKRNLEVAIDISTTSFWRYDVADDKFTMIYGNSFGNGRMTFNEWLNAIDDQYREEFHILFLKIIAGGLSNSKISFSRTVNGKATHYDVRMLAITNHKGNVTRIIGTRTDVTEDYNISHTLEQNNFRTQLALSASNSEYWEYDTQAGAFIRNATGTLPERRETMKYMLSCISPEDMTDEFREAQNTLLEKLDKSISIDLKMRNPIEKIWRVYHIDMLPIEKNSDGQVINYGGIRRDITDSTALRNQLAEKNAQLQLSIAASRIIPVTIDNDKGALSVTIENNMARNLFDIYSQHMSMDSFINFFAPNVSDTVRINIDRVLRGEANQYTGEAYAFDKHGNAVYFNLRFIGSNYSKSGKPHKILCLMQDVTEQKRLTTDLEKAKELAEQSNKLKSAFLANMSHEIRTPLNAIVGFSELLSETNDPNERSEYFSIIENNNEQLLRLINDILDLSKIEAGMMELKPEKFDLATVFQNSALTMQQKCVNPEVKFFIDNPFKKCIVTLDKNRLIQVWTNYVTNSIKYTPSGSITMGCNYHGGSLHIYVKDTGIGVAANKRDRLFKRFQKLDDFAKGTGLGLSIVKAIVEQSGGKVGFDSAEGEGSTFYADIPCEADLELK
jgi:PAS domain S-box-containing protein